MILLGYIPLLHAAAVVAIAVYSAWSGAVWIGLVLALGALYLAPPLLVRAASLAGLAIEGEHRAGSRAFLAWWFSAQWQVLFNRLTFLEEILRLVPSLYSLWLRCWGARIGRLVYWSPGVAVLDRQLVEVGDRAVIGLGARLVPHIVTRDEAGRLVLRAARIRIGHDAVVGGGSLVPAGASVEPFAVTRAAFPLHPFAHHDADGRRERVA